MSDDRVFFGMEEERSWFQKLGCSKQKIGVCGVFGAILLASILSIVFFQYIYDGTTIITVNDNPNSTPPPPPPTADSPKNLIFMISDGFGPASVTFARNMNPDKTPLPFDDMLIGVVNTYSSQNLVTDSAAGATAYACGIKTYNEAIAVDDNFKACGTSMEAAQRQGMITGLVVTSRITHATPAAFSSHVSNRDEEEIIAHQQAYNQSIDLLFGGGLDEYTRRSDGENLLLHMEERGYQVIFDVQELENTPLSLPLIGLFAPSHMDYEIDRVNEDPITQPSLAQMVEKALELLSAKAKAENKGFFLMIEGSRIDMAAHDNDAYTHYLEIMQYMDAISEVKAFVDENPNTYVISVSDHSTGGLTLGRRSSDGTYPIYNWYPQYVPMQNISVEKMSSIINGNSDLIYETFQTYANLTITEFEYEMVIWAKNTSDSAILKSTIGDIISKRANIGWTTPGHTGEDVNLYSYGARPAELTGMVMDNTAVGMAYFNEFNFWDEMQQITEELSDITFDPPSFKKTSECSHSYAGHN